MSEAETETQQTPEGPWRVVLVDDHAMFRSGVKHDIGSRVRLVGEGEDVPTAVRAILDSLPDVVLLDVHLPGGGGMEVIKQVSATQPGVKFLALSVSDAAEDVIGVIRAGARGYVTKSISADELVGRSDAWPPAMPCSRQVGRLRAGRLLGRHRRGVHRRILTA